jgi:hypothetical protein
VKNSNVTESNLLTNEVNIQLNVLGAAMMNGVGGEVDNRDVVAEDDSSLVNRAGELGEKLTKPRTLSNCIGHSMIFSLSAGPRDGVLVLGRPGDQRRSKVDAVAGGRAPSVRAARPVCI